MFDFSFSELLLIAVVALVVLGPERLPKAARFAGLWVRRARAQWDSVKSELERELEAEELKRSLHDAQASLRQAEAQWRDGNRQLQDDADALHREVSGRDAAGERDIDIRSDGRDAAPTPQAAAMAAPAEHTLPVADATPVPANVDDRDDGQRRGPEHGLEKPR